MPVLQILDRWLTKVEDFLAALGIAGLLVVIGAVCAEIVLRTFFAMPQVWVTEFTEYALLYVTFLGTAWLLRTNGHVGVDLLVHAVGDRAARRLALASAATGFAVAVVLLVFGVHTTIDLMRSGAYKPTVMEFPTWRVVAIIPVGSALLAQRYLHRLHALARGTLAPR